MRTIIGFIVFMLQVYVDVNGVLTEGCKCGQLAVQSHCENPQLFCKWADGKCSVKGCHERVESNCVPQKLYSSVQELTLCSWDAITPTDQAMADYMQAMQAYQIELARRAQLAEEEVEEVVLDSEEEESEEQQAELVEPKLKSGKCIMLNELPACADIDQSQYSKDPTKWAKICANFRCSIDPTTFKCIDLPTSCGSTPKAFCTQMYAAYKRQVFGKCVWFNETCSMEKLSMPPRCDNNIVRESCGSQLQCQWEAGKCYPLKCGSMGSSTCELLAMIDDQTGGNVCVLDEGSQECVEGDPGLLKMDACQLRSYNSYFWNGTACTNCTEGTAHRASGYILGGISILIFVAMMY